MTNTTKPPSADPAEITRALQLMWEPGTVMEMRCPKTPKGVVSGYYSELAPLLRDSTTWSGKSEAVYLTLNSVNPDLLARARNRAEPYAKHTTRDAEIVRRRWMLVDFDPVRPAGVSATDEEHAAALERAGQCRDWLLGQRWPLPVYADSGNGAHLLYRMDLPNDEESRRKLEQCLAILAARFDDAQVVVDQTTFNASRISKLYGTLAAKGDSVPELGRVHRIARILDVPAELQVVNLLGDVE